MTENDFTTIVRRHELTFSDRVRAFAPVRYDVDPDVVFKEFRQAIRSGPPLTNRVSVLDLRELPAHGSIGLGSDDIDLAPCLILAPAAWRVGELPAGFQFLDDEAQLMNWLIDHRMKKRWSSPVPLEAISAEEIAACRSSGLTMSDVIREIETELGVPA